MAPVTEPCRKTIVRNNCVLVAFFFIAKKIAKNKKNDDFGSPFDAYGCSCFYFFFDVFSRLAADPHPRGLETRFGAIFVDFGVISGWISARILSLEKGEFREKILQRPCTKSCRRLGLPHPHAQTLRVRRSRASVFNQLIN